MGALAGRNETNLFEGIPINHVDSVRVHVCHIKHGAIGRSLHVLRHAGRFDRQTAYQFLLRHIHLDEPLAEFAASNQVTAISGEIHVVDALAVRPKLVLQFHRLGVVEFEPFALLRHHDGVLTIGRVVHVVRVAHRDRLVLAAIAWIDPGEGVANIVEYPQRLQVPRWRHMLGLLPHLVVCDDLVGSRVDHVHGVAHRVRHVYARNEVFDNWAELPWPVGSINVIGIQHCRHPRQLVLDLPNRGGFGFGRRRLAFFGTTREYCNRSKDYTELPHGKNHPTLESKTRIAAFLPRRKKIPYFCEAAIAWPRSQMMSSRSSIPTESRTRSFDTPASSCCSSVSCWCVVEAG